MRVPLLAIVLLLGGSSAVLADDMPPPPVKIIDATPAPAVKSDQAAPASPAPPAVSSKAKGPEPTSEDSGNRFSFVRVDDGFLRFDLKTGQVAYCNPQPDGWACQAVPENRSALEREVASLKEEVAALKRQIENLREPPRPPAPVPPPAGPPAAQGDLTRDLPLGHEDIARAKAALRDVWQRFVDAIVGFRNDVMRQS